MLIIRTAKRNPNPNPSDNQRNHHDVNSKPVKVIISHAKVKVKTSLLEDGCVSIWSFTIVPVHRGCGSQRALAKQARRIY